MKERRSLSKVDLSEISRNEEEAKRARYERLFYRPLSIIGAFSVAMFAIYRFINYEEPINEMEIETKKIEHWNKKLEQTLKTREIMKLANDIPDTDTLTRKEITALLGINLWASVPIAKRKLAFSHDIHVGRFQIDCNYCHTGVGNSKSANIPSARICMNCHTNVKTKSVEIANLYEAIGYDEKNGTYADTVLPIEWVKVHDLPDLAYLKSPQTVQIVHGSIEEMDVSEVKVLDMGWCIDCHREGNLDSKVNKYYDELRRLMERSKKRPQEIEQDSIKTSKN